MDENRRYPYFLETFTFPMAFKPRFLRSQRGLASDNGGDLGGFWIMGRCKLGNKKP